MNQQEKDLLNHYPSHGINLSVTFSKQDCINILAARESFKDNSSGIFEHIITLLLERFPHLFYLATQHIQAELDKYFNGQVFIEFYGLSEKEGYEDRFSISTENTTLLYGDFSHYPVIDLYPGDEVDDICFCHYTDSATYLKYIEQYLNQSCLT